MPKGSADKPAPRGGGPKERAAAAKKDIKAGRAPAGKPAPTAKEKPVGAKGRAGAARQEIKAGRAAAGRPAPAKPKAERPSGQMRGAERDRARDVVRAKGMRAAGAQSNLNMNARPTMGSPLSDMGFGNRPM